MPFRSHAMEYTHAAIEVFNESLVPVTDRGVSKKQVRSCTAGEARGQCDLHIILVRLHRLDLTEPSEHLSEIGIVDGILGV